jgi:hypothetical protein
MNERFASNGHGTAIAHQNPVAIPVRKTDNNVTDFPSEKPEEVYIPWWKRQLLYGGILTMAGSQTKPPGFFVNLQTLALIVPIVLAILGGFWWTWERAIQKGIEIGVTQTEKRQLEERLQALEKEKQAKDLIKQQTGGK